MAMDKTRRTSILIETHEVTVVRFAMRSQRVFCDICGLEVPGTTAEQPALASVGASSSSIQSQKYKQETANENSQKLSKS